MHLFYFKSEGLRNIVTVPDVLDSRSRLICTNYKINKHDLPIIYVSFPVFWKRDKLKLVFEALKAGTASWDIWIYRCVYTFIFTVFIFLSLEGNADIKSSRIIFSSSQIHVKKIKFYTFFDCILENVSCNNYWIWIQKVAVVGTSDYSIWFKKHNL